VVEHAVTHPPAEGVLRAERLCDGSVEVLPLFAMRKSVFGEVADGRPQATGGSAPDGIGRIGRGVTGQRPEDSVRRGLEAGVP
jgi:hypothetical protein